MLKKNLKSLYRLIGYTAAILIINAAVLVTAIRLALPGIGHYKEEIQAWVSAYMDYPVTIDNIHAEWRGWVPHLYLENIDLYTQDGGQLIIRFDSAHLKLDLFTSLAQREIVPNYLAVSGLELEFTRNVDGSISISSDNVSRLNKNTGNNTALSAWLLKQNHIILEDARLVWNDQQDLGDPVEFKQVRLTLKTDNNRMQVATKVSLPHSMGKALRVKLDLTGDVRTANWSGDMYIEAQQVYPANLLKKSPLPASGGVANIKLWTNWQNAKLEQVDGELEYADFLLENNAFELLVEKLQIGFHGERKRTEDWILTTRIRELITANGSWPETDFQIQAHKAAPGNDYKYKAYSSYLKLDEVVPLLPAPGRMTDKRLLSKLDLGSISGELSDLNLTVGPVNGEAGNIRLESGFRALSLESSDNNYAVSGFDGRLSAVGDSIKLHLDTGAATIKLNPAYRTPLELSKLQADIEVELGQSPLLLINHLTAVTDELSIRSGGKIHFDEQASPFVDLIMHLDEMNIEAVSDYLPEQTDPDLSEWFEQAMVGGKILYGDLIFRGHLADYPFNNAEGNFKALLSISNATLEYDADWPPLDKLDAEVVFDNDDLYIASNSGLLFDARLQRVNARIKNISRDDPRVLVEALVSGHTTDAANVILQSPLHDNALLSELADTNIAGNLEVSLELEIPLDEELSTVNGRVKLIDTAIESDLPGLGLESINGDINFTRYSAWSDRLEALYHGTPVNLSLPFEASDADTDTFILSGTADKEFIAGQLISFFPAALGLTRHIDQVVSGASDWSLTVKKSRTDDNTTVKNIDLNLDLHHVAIALPYPLGKNGDEHRQLTITTELVGSSMEKIAINYGDSVFTDIIIDNAQDLTIKNILIGLGQRHSANTIPADISITGKLARLNLSAWSEFINASRFDSDNTIEENKSVVCALLINKLELLNKTFTDTALNLEYMNTAWRLSVDGRAIKGHADYVYNKPYDRLDIYLEHLTVHDSETEDVAATVNIHELPEMNVTIEKTVYNNNDLGQTTLITKNSNAGLGIEKLAFSKPGFSIDASGTWTQNDGIDRSELTAQLNSDSINTMLETFGYDGANIENGKTKINLTATWMDTPANFSIKKINGTLEMDIEQGQFLDLKPAAGRLFGLLSIQALPRKLSLDFSDIFNEGFTFDSIQGLFDLQQGHAYTNVLEMTGPAADIMVSGRTGLVTEDYDQVATVIPKISDSLPVASALFGPVGMGVGAVIYLTGELFDAIPGQIDRMMSLQYSITGSWDNPHIEKIKKAKNQSG